MLGTPIPILIANDRRATVKGENTAQNIDNIVRILPTSQD